VTETRVAGDNWLYSRIKIFYHKISTERCFFSFPNRYHKEKVQSLNWHPADPHSLATGCCDGRVRVADCRSEQSHKAWKVGGEVERVVWNPFNAFHCLASTDAGTVHCIDVRYVPLG
jgi:periodic tryptophan protein 1